MNIENNFNNEKRRFIANEKNLNKIIAEKDANILQMQKELQQSISDLSKFKNLKKEENLGKSKDYLEKIQSLNETLTYKEKNVNNIKKE